MAGMLQILTYLLALYLVMKGVEILQIALCSNRPNRRGVIFIGILALATCLVGGAFFADMQDKQAQTIGQAATATAPEQ